MHKNSYQIVLTEDEINTVYVLTGNVCGSSSSSPRKHSDTVYQKIRGMLGTKSFELVEHELCVGETRFNDYSVKTPQQLKIEELEATINEAQRKLQELKGL